MVKVYTASSPLFAPISSVPKHSCNNIQANFKNTKIASFTKQLNYERRNARQKRRHIRKVKENNWSSSAEEQFLTFFVHLKLDDMIFIMPQTLSPEAIAQCLTGGLQLKILSCCNCRLHIRLHLLIVIINNSACFPFLGLNQDITGKQATAITENYLKLGMRTTKLAVRG